MKVGQIEGHGSQRAAGQALTAGGLRDGFGVWGDIRMMLLLAAGLALYGLVLGAADALTLSRHEGDALHSAAIILRMAEGQWPHLDFMTPIGWFAFAPIALFVALGAGLGAAILLAQFALAILLLPAIWWVARSRLGTGWVGLAFGAIVLVLCVALTYTGPERDLTISMHYNRWAWAISFVVIALALVPARQAAPFADGVLYGLCFAALALIKAPYAVGLLPAVLLALALRREGAVVLVALGTGLAALGALTLVAGLAFWPAYIGDLLAVAHSEQRPAPGISFGEVLSAPSHLATTLLALAAVVVLRRGDRPTEGLILLVLFPGLALITWQNFGNDPQWVPAMALALLALRPAAAPRARQILATIAVAALALALPWMASMATTPQRLAGPDTVDAVPLLRGHPEHDDLRVIAARAEAPRGAVPLPGFEEAQPEPPWTGAALPECRLAANAVLAFHARAAEIEASGQGGRPALVADTFQDYWVFGEVAQLPGAAVWYYGGLPGGAAAEILVVPLCALSPMMRDVMVSNVTAQGWTLTETFRGDHVAILEIGRP